MISLYRTTASAFRAAAEQDCIQFGEIRFMNITGQSFDFEGEIQSVLFPSDLHLKGSRTYGENEKEVISLEISADDAKEQTYEQILKLLYSILQP